MNEMTFTKRGIYFIHVLYKDAIVHAHSNFGNPKTIVQLLM